MGTDFTHLRFYIEKMRNFEEFQSVSPAKKYRHKRGGIGVKIICLPEAPAAFSQHR